jgi:methyl-accepting chemotaxis protein
MDKTVSVTPDKLKELELLASIAINAFNSIILLDQNGDILWANKGFESLYGYTFEEYKDQHQKKNSGFIRILKDTDRNFFNTNPSLSFTHSFLNKAGDRKWVQTTLTPEFNDAKDLEKFIAIEIDITQQKEVEEELIQKQENTLTLSEHIESVKEYVEDQIASLNTQKEALKLAKEKSEHVLNKVI